MIYATIQRNGYQFTVGLELDSETDARHILEEMALLHNGHTTYELHKNPVLNSPDPERGRDIRRV